MSPQAAAGSRAADTGAGADTRRGAVAIADADAGGGADGEAEADALADAAADGGGDAEADALADPASDSPSGTEYVGSSLEQAATVKAAARSHTTRWVIMRPTIT